MEEHLRRPWSNEEDDDLIFFFEERKSGETRLTRNRLSLAQPESFGDAETAEGMDGESWGESTGVGGIGVRGRDMVAALSVPYMLV